MANAVRAHTGAGHISSRDMETPVLMNEWELWVCAARLLRAHGESALRHVDALVEESGRSGDNPSKLQWEAVRDRIRDLEGQGIRWLS